MNIDKYIEDFDQDLELRASHLASSIKSKKPKLKISKVPEDLRSVTIKLDIPIMSADRVEVDYYLQYFLDWSLNEQHISPKEYIVQLCEVLDIPPHHVKQLTKQLCFQLIEFIEQHSYEGEEPEPTPNNPEKRRPGRPVKNKQLTQPPQATPIKTTARLSQRTNQNCPNCQFLNTTVYDCKLCHLPLQLLEALNLGDPVVQGCINLYELILQRVGSLSFNARNRKLVKEDFSSLYTLRERIKEAVSPDLYATVDDLIGRIIKNNGPLPIERSTHRRTRKQMPEDSVSDSSNGSEQSFEPQK